MSMRRRLKMTVPQRMKRMLWRRISRMIGRNGDTHMNSKKTMSFPNEKSFHEGWVSSTHTVASESLLCFP